LTPLAIDDPERLAKGGYLSPGRYLEPGFMALEADRLWPRVWQVAGRVAEIPNPGDWITYDLLDLAIIVVRGEDGVVRGFQNVCPHRGSRLVDGRGSSPRFVCPYHCWAFELDGALAAVPEREGFPPLDARRQALRRVAVEAAAGFVFVHPDPDAEPLAAWLEGISEELALYRFDEMSCFLRRRLELPCNWKTCLDAFQEVYHVRGIHPQLLPGLKIGLSTFRYFGAHSRMINPNGDERARGSGTEDDLDLIAAFRRSKAEAASIDIGGLEERRITANFQYNVFPNLSINTHATGCQLFRFLPHASDPQRCSVDISLLERVAPGRAKPPEAEPLELGSLDSGVGFGRSLEGFELPASVESFGEDLLQIYAAALDQDFGALVDIQRGLRTRGLRELVLGHQEQRILHWNLLLDRCLEGEGFDDALRTRMADRAQ
jgi:phenylpropionate dioxygenase-like ring-hydroxylating dioxygenase large terminal subunit